MHRAAGAPSLRNVAMLAQQRGAIGEGQGRSALASAQRVSDWMSGRNVPARFESLLPVLQVLAARARRRAGTPGETLDLRAWRALWLAARSAPAALPETIARPPYPDADGGYGDHEPVLFGRRRQVVCLLEMIRKSADPDRAADVIVLTGASGVGKTALLRGGVVPALNAEAGRWAVTVVALGRDPLRALQKITDETTDSGGSERLLLIVDQFEQLFRPEVDAADRETFLLGLKRLSAIGSVLVSVRCTHLVDCSRYSWLANAVQHNGFRLNPMRRQELVSAIAGPPRSRGVTVDPGVVELIVTALDMSRPTLTRSAAEAGALPVLAATMRSLWTHHSGSRLDVAGYRRVGGVAGVVTRLAEQTWEGLRAGEQVDARRLLLALLTVHRDGTVVRRRLTLADLERIAARPGADLFERLVSARLITVESRHACLAHDSLLEWDRLRGWVAEHRELLIWRDRIEADAAEWETADRDPGLLYRSIRLTTAIHHADPALSPLATEFLRACARAELGAQSADSWPGKDYQDVS
ncbi:ATP-binding protein [Nocardia transvalensis]|uniref:nSTAND1 domain-containing NTPase n=1 Tax=Nocardia transvalensis TaxID=37333 RepID=UPI001895C29B|nr:ATP-binding protein [Nocardia transvalensis]MBF6332541.1 hypothetical protein [Nocardia transvalensis]